MNRTLLLVSAMGLAALGCSKAEKKSNDGLQPAKISQPATNNAPAHGAPHGAPHGAQGASKPAADAGRSGSAQSGQGKVVETMNSGGYTYVKLEGASGDEWAAAPETEVKVGDVVSYSGGMKMQNFHSNTLQRTFEVVYFVPGYTINGALPKAPSKAGAKASAGAGAADVELAGIAKAEGGNTVEELFAKKSELAGKEVSVRGKVVKYNGGIMGRNWIHLRDGSGAEGTNDITITTNATTQVGATILVKGKIALGKDFGAGYKYDVLIEDATVTAE